MKQLTQNLKTGEIKVEEVPAPAVKTRCILVKNYNSLISAGTEKTKIEMGEKSLLGKALARPDLVKQVFLKIRQEGLRSVYHKVSHRLESSTPLGYSCAGEVVEVGKDVREFNIGNRVACAGAGYANHAEFVCVPVNLCAKIQEGTSFEEASFTTIGAIALQGIHQADVKLGENVCVIGLGLLGQLTVQILKTAGCRIFGIDVDEKKVKLSEKLNAGKFVLRSEDIQKLTYSFTEGFGFDAVIITAATENNDPLILAGEIARDRGKIVIIGNVKMDIPRKNYYEKELQVIMSRSYGPGRYDQSYEEKGIDYPIGHVRWTEKRNMEEFLHMISKKEIKIDPLITHRFKTDNSIEAYKIISGKKKESYLGIILEYEKKQDQKITRVLTSPVPREGKKSIKVGLIGAGNFATGVLLPNLKKINDVEFCGICSEADLSAKNAATKFGFQYATSSVEDIFDDSKINTVFIITRHNLHSEFAIKSLNAKKITFVEKPLCITKQQLNEVIEATKNNTNLLVGFNRRYSPHTKLIKTFVDKRIGKCVINCRINAGPIPSNSWIHDPKIGGGRITSEVCHFVDLLYSLVGAKPKEIFARAISGDDPDIKLRDNLIVEISFSDGSIATIVYTSKGDVATGKERIEVFADGTSCIIDDFKSSIVTRNAKTVKKLKTMQDKGHGEELKKLLETVKSGGKMPISIEEIYYSTLTTLAIIDSLNSNEPVKI